MSLLFTGAVFFPSSYICVRLLLKRLSARLSTSDQSLIAEKCICSLQAIISTIVGIIIARTCQDDILYDKCVLTNLYAEFALPYFIYDIFAMYVTHRDQVDTEEEGFRSRSVRFRVLHFIRNTKLMLLHHILLPGIFYPVIIFFRRGIGDFFVGVAFCIEATIPFISLRFILAQLKLKHTAAYIISGLLMIVTFFIFRICVFPYLYWRYAIYAGIQLQEVPLKIPIHCNLGSLGLFVLQVYWMWLMVRGAIRVFYKMYHMKKS